MKNLDHIRKEIEAEARRGDYTAVGRLVGLKPDTLRRVVRGTRQNEAALTSFHAYLQGRKRLEQQLAQPAQ